MKKELHIKIHEDFIIKHNILKWCSDHSMDTFFDTQRNFNIYKTLDDYNRNKKYGLVKNGNDQYISHELMNWLENKEHFISDLILKNIKIELINPFFIKSRGNP